MSYIHIKGIEAPMQGVELSKCNPKRGGIKMVVFGRLFIHLYQTVSIFVIVGYSSIVHGYIQYDGHKHNSSPTMYEVQRFKIIT